MGELGEEQREDGKSRKQETLRFSEKYIKATFFREKHQTVFNQGCGAFLVAQMVKNLPAMWETWVQSLGWEDPLEKGMATHSSTLAWRIPWTEKPGMGSQKVRYD